MSSRDSIAFHEVTASFNEEQWLRLDNGQREAYRNAMKEIHLTLIAQGYTILNPSTIFSIKKQNESYVRFDIQSMEMKSAVVGDFPDILMKVKEEPVGETPISQGEHCVSQPSTSSGLASFNNIKQECSTYGSINSGSSTNLTDSSPRTSNAALTKAIGPAEKFPIQALEALISGIPKDDTLPRTSNAALINAEEKRFSIDNSGGGGEGTPGNSADQAPFMQALMTPILVFGTQNFILAGNLNVPLRPQEDTSSDTLPKTSNAALITSEEERFSIDDYNRGGGEGTPGNSAGVPGVMKQEPDDDGDEETDNENLENINVGNGGCKHEAVEIGPLSVEAKKRRIGPQVPGDILSLEEREARRLRVLQGNVKPWLQQPNFPSNPIRTTSDIKVESPDVTSITKDIVKIAWCKCDHCCQMSTAEESVCCHDISGMHYPLNEDCITLHPTFKELCLDQDRLDFLYRFLGRIKRRNDILHYLHKLRRMSYRAFVVWAHGSLDKRNCKPVPACVVKLVQELLPYPKELNIGYKKIYDYPAAIMALDHI